MLLIKNGTLLDPFNHKKLDVDILIKDGKIKELAKNIKEIGNTIDAKGLYISPGFVDGHVHLRDYNQNESEDIHSGAKAAAAGGYTTIIAMANTKPVMDSVEMVKDFYQKAEKEDINIYTVAALTEGQQNERLVDIETLKKAGIIALSDDGIPNTDANLIRKAMQEAKKYDLPISFHEEDPTLIETPGINQGKISDHYSLEGAPSVAEDIAVARDCALALDTGASIVIQHISSGRAVDIVRYYKSLGAKVSAEVTPHHFSSTEELLLQKGALAKVNPPIRTDWDRQMIIEGLKDGTIDTIATDHAPHAGKTIDSPLLDCPSGMIGLETSLGLGITNLVRPGHLSLLELVERMTVGPAKVYGLDVSVDVGSTADLTIIDPDYKWTVDKGYSKSQNSPYMGENLYGKAVYTIANGKIVQELR